MLCLLFLWSRERNLACLTLLRDVFVLYSESIQMLKVREKMLKKEVVTMYIYTTDNDTYNICIILHNK